MFTSTHHPSGDANHHFDNEQVTTLICRYQSCGDQEALAGVLAAAQQRTLTLSRFYGADRYLSEGELTSNVTWKLLRGLHRFDAWRGRAFSFISTVAMNEVRTGVTRTRVLRERYIELDETIAGQTPHPNGDAEAGETIEHLVHSVRANVRSTISDPDERAVLRWFTESFCADGFESARHQCCNAALQVFSWLRPARACELHDLARWQCRLVLLPHAPPRTPIIPGKLLGTRGAWLVRYQHLMSPVEFDRFARLLMGLAPFILLLVDPQSRSRRGDRNASITRRNVEFALHGDPSSAKLFA